MRGGDEETEAFKQTAHLVVLMTDGGMFLVLVPMWLFNILRIVPPRFLWLSLLTKFWWSGWMLGFFINIWTIKTY